jgi:hypothetical protein
MRSVLKSSFPSLSGFTYRTSFSPIRNQLQKFNDVRSFYFIEASGILYNDQRFLSRWERRCQHRGRYVTVKGYHTSKTC